MAKRSTTTTRTTKSSPKASSEKPLPDAKFVLSDYGFNPEHIKLAIETVAAELQSGRLTHKQKVDCSRFLVNSGVQVANLHAILKGTGGSFKGVDPKDRSAVKEVAKRRGEAEKMADSLPSLRDLKVVG